VTNGQIKNAVAVTFNVDLRLTRIFLNSEKVKIKPFANFFKPVQYRKSLPSRSLGTSPANFAGHRFLQPVSLYGPGFGPPVVCLSRFSSERG